MDASEKINNFHQAFDDIIYPQSSSQPSYQSKGMENQSQHSFNGSFQQNLNNSNMGQQSFPNQNIFPGQVMQGLMDGGVQRQQQHQSGMFMDINNNQNSHMMHPSQFNSMQASIGFNPNAPQLNQQSSTQNYQQQMQNQFFHNQSNMQQVSNQQSQHSSMKSLMQPPPMNMPNQYQSNSRGLMANPQFMMNNNTFQQHNRNMNMNRRPMTPNSMSQSAISPQLSGEQLKNHMQNVSKIPSNIVARNQPSFNLQNCSVNNNRLNFCVRRGNLIQPFRLDHNTNSACKTYEIRDIFYEELMWREDLDLQLRCFHHEDRFMRVNWPKDINVEINDQKLEVDRTGDAWQQQPLLIKGVCHAGINTMKISVSSCACSHLFILQLIHRPTILDVMTLIMTKQRLNITAITKKIRTFFSKQGLNNQNGSRVDFVTVSRECPISKKPIVIPIRGSNCTHLQCFDLESYLFLNKERSLWRCPVCFASVLVEFIEVDDFMLNVLKSASPFSPQKIKIYPDGQWKPESGQYHTQPITPVNPNNQSQDNVSSLLNRQNQSNSIQSPISFSTTQNAVNQGFNNNINNNILNPSNKQNQAIQPNVALESPTTNTIDEINMKQNSSPNNQNLQLFKPSDATQAILSPTSIILPNSSNVSDSNKLSKRILPPMDSLGSSTTKFSKTTENQHNEEKSFEPEAEKDLDIEESLKKAFNLQDTHDEISLEQKNHNNESGDNIMPFDVEFANSIVNHGIIRQDQINSSEFGSLSERYFDNEDLMGTSGQNIKFGTFDELDSEFVMN